MSERHTTQEADSGTKGDPPVASHLMENSIPWSDSRLPGFSVSPRLKSDLDSRDLHFQGRTAATRTFKE